jgi:response regulator NasT
MTEAQAFRWIQKTSMDRRQTMRSVAEEVLAEAEQQAAAASAAQAGEAAAEEKGQDGSEPTAG